MELARTVENRFTESWVNVWSSIISCTQGAWEAAIHSADSGMAVAQAMGDRWTSQWCVMSMSYAIFMKGQRDIGLSMLRKNVEDYKKLGAPLMVSWHVALFGDALSVAGDADEAMSAIRELRSLEETGDVFGVAWAGRSLAIMVARSPHPDWPSVFQELDASDALAGANGALPVLAVNEFRRSEILHKKGDLPAALEQLAQAEKLFTGMEMAWWSEQALGLRGRIEGGKKFVWFAPYVDGPPKV
jgi:hypothetical protein